MTKGTNGRFPWEGEKKFKAASYARDLEATRDLPYEEKFSGLIAMCQEASKKEFHIVVAASPEILGDDYEELMENLRRIAEAGLMVAFAVKP